MNRQLIPSQSKGYQKLYVEYKDNNISSGSYLLKFQDRSVSQASRSCDFEMQLHPQWKYYMVLQLQNSRCFRMKFFCWILVQLQIIEGKHQSSVKLCEHCRLTQLQSKLPSHPKHPKIKVKLETLHDTLHNMEPEIEWSIRILQQMLEHLQLEAVFAWLSTLGGAHSALGDYFNKNAEIAWELSLKQLYIAVKIGNPTLTAHCKLFMSISLMQRGHFIAASKIIRSVTISIVNDKRLQERRLINCCKAAKVRLKYIRQQRKETRNGVHS